MIHVGSLGTVLVCSTCAATLRKDPTAQLSRGPFGFQQPALASDYFDGQAPTVVSGVVGEVVVLAPCAGCDDTRTVGRYEVRLLLCVDAVPSTFDRPEVRAVDLAESAATEQIVWKWADPDAKAARVEAARVEAEEAEAARVEAEEAEVKAEASKPTKEG